MRIFLLGATPTFDRQKHRTTQERLAATGGNAGNQIIAHGLLETIQHSEVAWDYSIGPERVDAEFDVIVIAAANFLFPAFDFSGMANFIARTKLPVVMAGLGAQASDRSVASIPLQEGTARLIRLVSERSAAIGVRGEYTARVLKQLGIANTQIIGCPSYYAVRAVGYSIRVDALTDSSPIAVHASRDVVRHSSAPERMRDVIFQLYGEAARRDAIFVAQTEMEEIALADVASSSEREIAASAIRNFFNQPTGGDDIARWLGTRARVFWSPTEWVDAMRSFAFVAGTRFHGTIAALHAGTPAACICHDARTSEMCEFLSVPAIDLEAVSHIDFAEMRAKLDFERLRVRHRYLVKEYVRFLNLNGLQPSGSILP